MLKYAGEQRLKKTKAEIDMQTEAIKKRIIQGLASEINLIGSIELEHVGHALIELIEGNRLVHHGLNIEYRPVGYTVDSFTQDGKVVGEYSTLKTYFDDISKKDDPPEYSKISADIDHAVKHSNPRRIYLICSQDEPESFREKYNNTAHGKQHLSRVEIYDARELAKLIHQFSVENPTVAAYFSQFFPGFSQNLESFEYYGRVPSHCENHQPESLISDAIQAHLSCGQRICVLHGVSGTGKTQAAIDYVYKNVARIGNYIWIAGEDLRQDSPLSSIKRSRGGVPINVAGAFNSVPTLLVIDNLHWTVDSASFAELEQGLNAGGVILVTSTLNSPGSDFYIATPPLSFETAAKVLGEDVQNLSPVATNFINACRFSPLILATARNVCKDRPFEKEVFYQEVLDIPEILTNPNGKSIMRGLLERLDKRTYDALVKIANTGISRHDGRFLSSFIGSNQSTNLQRLSILQSATSPGLLKVHDLICDAVREESQTEPLAQALEASIEKLLGEMLPTTIRQIHLCEERLVEAHRARGARTPDWLMYALMQTDTDSKAEVASGLETLAISDSCSLAEVLCIVDAKEQFAYSINDDERRAYFQQCAEEYAQALADGVREELAVELLHHRGKAIRRTGVFEPALACFNELLTYRPDWHAAHGQISHLGIQYKADAATKSAGEASIRWLMDRMMFDLSNIPLRVSLAAITHLRSYPNVVKEISSQREKVGHIADLISISALEGLDQFYEAFAAFTSKFGYGHPELVVALAESIPELLSVPPESIGEKQWASACEALSNAAISARGANKPSLSERLLASMEIFAHAIVASGTDNPYTVRVVVKAFVTAGLPDTALQICEKAAPSTKDHWILYRKSQALLDINQEKHALDVGREALDGALKDSKAKEHIPSYHEQLSKCAEAHGDLTLAVACCEDAIKAGPNDKYLLHLEERLARLQPPPKPPAEAPAPGVI